MPKMGSAENSVAAPGINSNQARLGSITFTYLK